MKKLLLLFMFIFISCSGPAPEPEIDIELNPEVATHDFVVDRSIASKSADEPGEFKEFEMENGSSDQDVIEKQYTVEKGETLMMISFKLYGDYARWREIAGINQQVLNGGTELSEGMVLRYLSTGKDFEWNPKGNPYLIKWGDTLGTISKDVYGKTGRWKEIWYNNRPLVKDPDKIFAGFTLFYLNGENEM